MKANAKITVTRAAQMSLKMSKSRILRMIGYTVGHKNVPFLAGIKSTGNWKCRTGKCRTGKWRTIIWRTRTTCGYVIGAGA